VGLETWPNVQVHSVIRFLQVENPLINAVLCSFCTILGLIMWQLTPKEQPWHANVHLQSTAINNEDHGNYLLGPLRCAACLFPQLWWQCNCCVLLWYTWSCYSRPIITKGKGCCAQESSFCMIMPTRLMALQLEGYEPPFLWSWSHTQWFPSLWTP